MKLKWTICYASKTLDEAQVNYSTIEKEIVKPQKFIEYFILCLPLSLRLRNFTNTFWGLRWWSSLITPFLRMWCRTRMPSQGWFDGCFSYKNLHLKSGRRRVNENIAAIHLSWLPIYQDKIEGVLYPSMTLSQIITCLPWLYPISFGVQT